jgi:hypothetical protein
LEELGVVKHHGFYAVPHANGDATRGLLSLDSAGEVLVIAKCLPGRASAVAVEIDDAAIPEIVGHPRGRGHDLRCGPRSKIATRGDEKIWQLFGLIRTACVAAVDLD